MAGENEQDMPNAGGAAGADVAGRRAWFDPRVRFMWLVALVLLVTAAGFATTGATAWSRENNLVQHGAPVKARIFNRGDRRKNALVLMDGAVDLDYEYGGKAYTVTGMLPVREGSPRTGEMIDVLVDPAQPEVWSNRKVAPPLHDYVLAPLLLLPMALGTLGAAWLVWGRLLRTWRTGEARDAVVVRVRQTPLAPTSQLVDCVAADGSDKRVISVYVPGRIKLAKGDRIRVKVRPDNPRRAIAVEAFR